LEWAAHVNIVTYDGHTCLERALLLGNLDVADVLDSFGANYSWKDEQVNMMKRDNACATVCEVFARLTHMYRPLPVPSDRDSLSFSEYVQHRAWNRPHFCLRLSGLSIRAVTIRR
jgi:hypothetical protein